VRSRKWLEPNEALPHKGARGDVLSEAQVVESEWISTLSRGWSWAMYRPSWVMERLIAKASVEQRCVLGFPRPGHSYWTQETIAAVQARYGSLGIDMTPYAHALAVRSGHAAP
jgi:hypothetical protein